jgi:CRP/FNR family cyclic AMP-dependent transcriptional regulator
MEQTFTPDQIDAHRLLMQVSAGRTTTTLNNNQSIFRQGDDANFVFFVQEGSVELTRVLSNGSETIIGTAHQGQFFGEACLHDVPLRLATATAIGNCRITSVTKEVMLSKIQSQPKLAKLFVEFLSNHNIWVKKELLGHLLKPSEAA